MKPLLVAVSALYLSGCIFVHDHRHPPGARVKVIAVEHGATPVCHPSESWDGKKCKHKGEGKGGRKHDRDSDSDSDSR